MIDASLLSALTLPLVVGVATFFSPCAYPLLPGYVGFYASQTDRETASLSGSIARGVVAGLGVLATLVALFGATFWIGHSTLSNVVLFEPIAGGLLVVLGLLILLDRAPSLSIALPKRRSSVLGFGIFGAGYALAGAGCVAGPLIALASYALTLSPPVAALVIATYVGTVTLLMVSLTVATGVGIVASGGWLSAHTKTVERLAGAVMIVAGLGQLYLAVFVLDAI